MVSVALVVGPFYTYVAPSIGICTTSYRCLSRLGQHSIDRWLVGVMTNAISPDLSGGLAPETKNRDPDGHRNETIFGSNVDPESPVITLYQESAVDLSTLNPRIALSFRRINTTHSLLEMPNI